MQQNQATTLLEFLQASGVKLRIYDMGRRIISIPLPQFLQFERTELPYPQPLQNHAWFGLCLQEQVTADDPVIWFLRLPLDEQGKLVQASRDYFIHRLLEDAVAKQAGKTAETGAFEDNPYIFKPKEDKMAVLHARLAHDLELPPSRYYQHALEYFSGTAGWDQWAFVGYQGIADVAVRHRDEATEALLIAAIPALPTSPLVALCHCLENESLTLALSQVLLDRLDTELSHAQPEPAAVSALVRGISLSESSEIKNCMFDRVIDCPLANQVELLASISGRAWELLLQPETAARYLEALVKSDGGQDVFNHCMADLLAIPGLRNPLLQAVRNPQRSDALASAFGAMVQGVATS